MSDLPATTLFMLMSVDGKISTGAGDERDFDKDFPLFAGVREGLSQYYELEERTDLFSFNTGKVMAKVGWNEEKGDIQKLPVSFIIVDNKPHLTDRGVLNLLNRTTKLYVVTTNDQHPALLMEASNLEVVRFKDKIDFIDLFRKLKTVGVDKLTVQSGGDMNAVLMRTGLISHLSIVIAPVIVGGRDTPSLIGGKSLQSVEDLELLQPLELIGIEKLNDSYHAPFPATGNAAYSG